MSTLQKLLFKAFLKLMELQSLDVGEEVVLAKERLSQSGRKYGLRLIAVREK